MSPTNPARFSGRPYKLFDGHALYPGVNLKGAWYWRYKCSVAGKEEGFYFGVYPDVYLLEVVLLS